MNTPAVRNETDDPQWVSTKPVPEESLQRSDAVPGSTTQRPTDLRDVPASDEPSASSIALLYSIPEPHPTWRSDVRLLFGNFMQQAGVRVDLVALSKAPDAAWPSGKVISRRDEPGWRRHWNTLRLQCGLFRSCRDGYDALIVRDMPILGLIGYLAAHRAGIPFLYWMSFPLAEGNLVMSRQRQDLSPLRRALLWLRGMIGCAITYRLLLPRCDWLFAQSDVMVAELRQKGITHDRILAVPMGVDTDRLPPKPAKLPPQLIGRRVAVYLGTLDRYRNPEIMIDIAKLVAREFPDFLLMVIGEADEPTDRGWLQSQAQHQGASRYMWFTGRLPFDQGQALLQLAEVGLSPFPRSELLESASPTKAVEYLAAGVPVVCNDQPDQAKVIRESGGGWCTELSAQAFASAVIECLRDPERSRRMGQAGRSYVQSHRSYAQLSGQVITSLRTVMQTTSARP